MGRIVPVLMHVDRDAKLDAERILAAQGLTLSEAFDLFLRQIAAEEGLPFDAALQDMVSAQAMESLLAGSAPALMMENTSADPADDAPSIIGWDSPLYMPLPESSAAQETEPHAGKPDVST